MQKLVFFVDDDKMILNLLEYTINNRDDCEIMTFQSGEACLENLYLNPDLIILDHVFKSAMDNPLNGLQTLNKIREERTDIPVIILSAREDEELKNDFLKAGATKYIPKNDYFIDALIETMDKEL